MAHKATHQHTDSSSAVPVVLFGVDHNGKPKAARFNDKHANLATKAAGHLKLHVLPIVGPVVVDLGERVPAGRIHANGRGFVPYIRRDLYAKLVAAAGSPSHGDHASTQAAAASGSTKHSSSNGHADPPKNWDEIAPGHVVIALDEPGEGWYETIVVETSGDMLTLRWRDYPRERRITPPSVERRVFVPARAAGDRPYIPFAKIAARQTEESGNARFGRSGTCFSEDVGRHRHQLPRARQRRWAVADLVGGDPDRQERPHVLTAVAGLSPGADHHPAPMRPRPVVPERPLISLK
jgi:hypothetical protein